MIIKNVTNLKLHDYKGNLDKSWYVGFNYDHPITSSRQAVQIRWKLNSFSSRTERNIQAKALLNVVTKAIEDGWQPYNQSFEDFLCEGAIKDNPGDFQNLESAMSFALEHGSWSHKTKLDYSNCSKFFIDAANILKLNRKPISGISKRDIMMLADHIKKTRKNWTNKSYNKNLSYISSLFSILEEWEIISFNPVKKIKKLPVAETIRYIPYTTEECKKIQEHLYLNHYRYFVYLMVIHESGIRPKEVLALRVKDVSLKMRTITIIPDMQLENSKTKKVRRVPITNDLLLFFNQMHLETYPEDYFVFGSPCKHNEGGRGKIKATDSNYFSPSSVKVMRNTTSSLWKRLVMAPIEDGGLGINKYQYAMKHTGANSKIMAGVDINSLRAMYGHSSTLMTERYINNIQQYYFTEIIDKSPSFVTINKPQ